MGRKKHGSGMSTKQTIGIILIMAGMIPFVPFIKNLDWIAALATLAIGLYLLIK